jgi:hypothetical protein
LLESRRMPPLSRWPETRSAPSCASLRCCCKRPLEETGATLRLCTVRQTNDNYTSTVVLDTVSGPRGPPAAFNLGLVANDVTMQSSVLYATQSDAQSNLKPSVHTSSQAEGRLPTLARTTHPVQSAVGTHPEGGARGSGPPRLRSST